MERWRRLLDVTVDDDETASSGVTLSVSPESVAEGAAETTVTVTARLDGGTRFGDAGVGDGGVGDGGVGDGLRGGGRVPDQHRGEHAVEHGQFLSPAGQV